jgi:hypothetical protein
MARRTDTGWRDSLLAQRHLNYGFMAPAPGMILPMIEYDKGRAVGVVSYLPLSTAKPSGPDVASAYRAFGILYDSAAMDRLPFLTARYDRSDWSFEVYPHNESARVLVGRSGWLRVSESGFAELLYGMRGRELPDLSSYGVTWNTTLSGSSADAFDGLAEKWPGQAVSIRRRDWEPETSVPFRLRVPCLDVDFAVVDRDDRLALLVDYKAAGGRLPVNLQHPNLKALASITTGPGARFNVPAYVAEYTPGRSLWSFRVHCLNRSAELHLAYALGATDASTEALAETVSGATWVDLSEPEWVNVLRASRDL